MMKGTWDERQVTGEQPHKPRKSRKPVEAARDPHPAAAPDAGEQQEGAGTTTLSIRPAICDPEHYPEDAKPEWRCPWHDTVAVTLDDGRRVCILCEQDQRVAHPAHLERTEHVGEEHPADQPVLTNADREQMRANSHFDPLRQQLRDRAETFKEAARAIDRYLSSPSQCSEQSARKLWLAPARAAEWQPLNVLDAFPTSWLDPLLTGPDAVVGNPPFWCPDVERLLAAVKERVEKLLPPLRPHGQL